MSGLQEFKCPSCGGSVEFNSSIQKMKCPYCDTEFDMEALGALEDELQNDAQEEMQWETKAGSEWKDGEEDGLRSYICKSCGGEIIGDETMAATLCPYCNNPVVMKGQFSGALRPDYVIPFKLDKKAAKEGLKKHLSGKRLLPKIFKEENYIDEIKGIYVPFWLFDVDVDANIRYRATKLRSWSDSKYDYIETRYYSVKRSGSIGFDKIPVDGSMKMADDLMESIEPYDVSGLVDFQTAYLSGYLADRYDVDAEQSIERANQRVKQSTQDAFADSVRGYSHVDVVSSNLHLENGTAKYALYPVWILNTKWKDKSYTFAMNGQTGKFIGDLPVDKKAVRKWLFGLTALCSALTYGLVWIFWYIGIFG